MLTTKLFLFPFLLVCTFFFGGCVKNERSSQLMMLPPLPAPKVTPKPITTPKTEKEVRSYYDTKEFKAGEAKNTKVLPNFYVVTPVPKKVMKPKSSPTPKSKKVAPTATPVPVIDLDKVPEETPIPHSMIKSAVIYRLGQEPTRPPKAFRRS